MNKLVIGTAALALLATAACSNLSAREDTVLKDAGIGTAAGAVLGGVTGHDPVTGAVIGGAAGGAYGAYDTRRD